MITIYGTDACTNCENVKSLLKNYDVKFEYVNIINNINAYTFIRSKGHTNVPQVYDKQDYLGDYDMISKMQKSKAI